MKIHCAWQSALAALSLVVFPGCQSAEDPDPKQSSEIYQCLDANQPSARIALASPAGDSSLDTAQKKPIQLFQAYPPVAGKAPDTPDYVNIKADGRGEKGSDGFGQTNSNIGWIEPGSFQDSTGGVMIPAACLSVAQVVTTESYTAKNVILDGDCNVVREFEYEFALAPGGPSTISYLAWDARNAQGNYVREGGYYWNIEIEKGGAKTLLRNRVRLSASNACPLPK